MDTKGRVKGAGGMFIQVLPETGGTKKVGAETSSSPDFKADEELITRVENAISACPSLGKWFDEKGNINDIVYGLFREFKPQIAVRRNITYDCPCNEDYYLEHIKSLGSAQIEDLKSSGPDPLEIVCRNCGSVYKIPFAKL